MCPSGIWCKTKFLPSRPMFSRILQAWRICKYFEIIHHKKAFKSKITTKASHCCCTSVQKVWFSSGPPQNVLLCCVFHRNVPNDSLSSCVIMSIVCIVSIQFGLHLSVWHLFDFVLFHDWLYSYCWIVRVICCYTGSKLANCHWQYERFIWLKRCLHWLAGGCGSESCQRTPIKLLISQALGKENKQS